MSIDIDQSFYNTGTASVDNGGTVVTGQGTQWVSSIRANDIFGTHKGDGVRILSVESNTSLTLAYPWQGDSQTDEPYEIQFTPYDTGYYPAVRQLLQTMASGNIEAFAALDGSSGTLPYFTGSGAMGVLPGEPNKVPIFTGTNSMDLADPATFGIQDPNGSLAKLAGLTLGNRQILQTDGSGTPTLLPLAARQILQTDANGALKAIALTANKLVNTDANGDILLSDITPYARTLLDDANGAAMWSTLGGAQNLAYSNGYTKLPNGLIIQWGFRAVPPASGSTTFGITYPTGVFGVWAQMASSDANVVASILLNSISTSGFSYLKGYIPRTGGVGGGAGGVDFFFISMGF